MTMLKFPQLTDDAMRRRLEPPTGRMRLIIDTDTHNEIDDQFAIAWALLSQDRFDVEGVCAEPYSFQHLRDRTNAAYDLLKANPGAALPPELAAFRRVAHNHLSIGSDPHQLHYDTPAEGMELSYQEILTVYSKLNEDPTGKGVSRFSRLPDFARCTDPQRFGGVHCRTGAGAG